MIVGKNMSALCCMFKTHILNLIKLHRPKLCVVGSIPQGGNAKVGSLAATKWGYGECGEFFPPFPLNMKKWLKYSFSHNHGSGKWVYLQAEFPLNHGAIFQFQDNRRKGSSWIILCLMWGGFSPHK